MKQFLKKRWLFLLLSWLAVAALLCTQTAQTPSPYDTFGQALKSSNRWVWFLADPANRRSNWPTGSAYTNLFTGSGTTGAVTSAAGDAGKYYRADGTWQTVSGGGGSPIQNPVLVADASSWAGRMTGYGSTTNNAAVPVYWTATTATGSREMLGYTSSDTNNLQTRYDFQRWRMSNTATNWSGGTAAVVEVQMSTTTNNLIPYRVERPDGVCVTTNLKATAANTIELIYLTTNFIGAFVPNTLSNCWGARADFQARNSTTSAVGRVWVNLQ